jgi:hypothetical protein
LRFVLERYIASDTTHPTLPLGAWPRVSPAIFSVLNESAPRQDSLGTRFDFDESCFWGREHCELALSYNEDANLLLTEIAFVPAFLDSLSTHYSGLELDTPSRDSSYSALSSPAIVFVTDPPTQSATAHPLGNGLTVRPRPHPLTGRYVALFVSSGVSVDVINFDGLFEDDIVGMWQTVVCLGTAPAAANLNVGGVGVVAESPLVSIRRVPLAAQPGRTDVADGYYHLTLKGRSNVGLATVAEFYIGIAGDEVGVDPTSPLELRLTASGDVLDSHDVTIADVGFDPVGYEVIFMTTGYSPYTGADAVDWLLTWGGSESTTPTFDAPRFSLDPTEPSGTVAGTFSRFSVFTVCLRDQQGRNVGSCYTVSDEGDGQLDADAEVALAIASSTAVRPGTPGVYYYTVEACTFVNKCNAVRSKWIVVSPDPLVSPFPALASLSSGGLVSGVHYTAPTFLSTFWSYDDDDLRAAPLQSQRMMLGGAPAPVDCSALPLVDADARAFVLTAENGGQACVVGGPGQVATFDICTTSLALPQHEVCQLLRLDITVTDDAPLALDYAFADAYTDNTGLVHIQSPGLVEFTFDSFFAAFSSEIVDYVVETVSSCQVPFEVLEVPIVIAADSQPFDLGERAACELCAVCDSLTPPQSSSPVNLETETDARRCACCAAVQVGCSCRSHPFAWTPASCVGDASVASCTPTVNADITGDYASWFEDTFDLTHASVIGPSTGPTFPVAGPVRRSATRRYDVTLGPYTSGDTFHIRVTAFGATDAIQASLCTPSVIVDAQAPGTAVSPTVTFSSGVVDGFLVPPFLLGVEWTLSDGESGIVSVVLELSGFLFDGSPWLVHRALPATADGHSKVPVPLLAVGVVDVTVTAFDAADLSVSVGNSFRVDDSPPVVGTPASSTDDFFGVSVSLADPGCRVFAPEPLELVIVGGAGCEDETGAVVTVNLSPLIDDPESGIASVHGRLVGELHQALHVPGVADGVGATGGRSEFVLQPWRVLRAVDGSATSFEMLAPRLASMPSGVRGRVQLTVTNGAGMSVFVESRVELSTELTPPVCLPTDPVVSFAPTTEYPRVSWTSCGDAATGVTSMRCALVSSLDGVTELAATSTRAVATGDRFLVPVPVPADFFNNPFDADPALMVVLNATSFAAACTFCNGVSMCATRLSSDTFLPSSLANQRAGMTGTTTNDIFVTRACATCDPEEVRHPLGVVQADASVRVHATSSPLDLIAVHFGSTADSLPASASTDWLAAASSLATPRVFTLIAVLPGLAAMSEMRVCGLFRDGAVACRVVGVTGSVGSTAVDSATISRVATASTSPVFTISMSVALPAPYGTSCTSCLVDYALVQVETGRTVWRSSTLGLSSTNVLIDDVLTYGTEYQLVATALDRAAGIAFRASSPFSLSTEADDSAVMSIRAGDVPDWRVPSSGTLSALLTARSTAGSAEVALLAASGSDAELSAWKPVVTPMGSTVTITYDVAGLALDVSAVRVCARLAESTVCTVPIMAREPTVADPPSCATKWLPNALVCSIPYVHGGVSSFSLSVDGGGSFAASQLSPIFDLTGYSDTDVVARMLTTGGVSADSAAVQVPRDAYISSGTPSVHPSVTFTTRTVNDGKGLMLDWSSATLNVGTRVSAVCSRSLGCLVVNDAEVFTVARDCGRTEVFFVLLCNDVGVCSESDAVVVPADSGGSCAGEAVLDGETLLHELVLPRHVQVDRSNGISTLVVAFDNWIEDGDVVQLTGTETLSAPVLGGSVEVPVPSSVADGSAFDVLVLRGGVPIAEGASRVRLDGSPPLAGHMDISHVQRQAVRDPSAGTDPLIVTVSLSGVVDGHSGIAYSQVCLNTCADPTVAVACGVVPGSSHTFTFREASAGTLYPCFVASVEVVNGAGVAARSSSTPVRLDVPELDLTELQSLVQLSLHGVDVTEVGRPVPDGSALTAVVTRSAVAAAGDLYGDVEFDVVANDGSGHQVLLADAQPFPLVASESITFRGVNLPFFPPTDVVSAYMRVYRRSNFPVVVPATNSVRILPPRVLNDLQDVYDHVIDGSSTDWDSVESATALTISYDVGGSCHQLSWPAASRPTLLRDDSLIETRVTLTLALSDALHAGRWLSTAAETHLLADGAAYPVPFNSPCVALSPGQANVVGLSGDTTHALCATGDRDSCAPSFFLFLNVEREHVDRVVRRFSFRMFCSRLLGSVSCRFAGVAIPTVLRDSVFPSEHCETRYALPALLAGSAYCDVRLPQALRDDGVLIASDSYDVSRLDGGLFIVNKNTGAFDTNIVSLQPSTVYTWPLPAALPHVAPGVRFPVKGYGNYIVTFRSDGSNYNRYVHIVHPVTGESVLIDYRSAFFESTFSMTSFIDHVSRGTLPQSQYQPNWDGEVKVNPGSVGNTVTAVGKYAFVVRLKNTVVTCPDPPAQTDMRNSVLTMFMRADPNSWDLGQGSAVDAPTRATVLDVDHCEMDVEATRFGSTLALSNTGRIVAAGVPGLGNFGFIKLYQWFDDGLYSYYIPRLADYSDSSNPFIGVVSDFPSDFTGLGTGLSMSSDGRTLVATDPSKNHARVYHLNHADHEALAAAHVTAQTIPEPSVVGNGLFDFGKNPQLSRDGHVMGLGAYNRYFIYTRSIGSCDWQLAVEQPSWDIGVWYGGDLAGNVGDYGEEVLVGTSSLGVPAGEIRRWVPAFDRYSFLYHPDTFPRPRRRYVVKAVVEYEHSPLPGRNYGWKGAGTRLKEGSFYELGHSHYAAHNADPQLSNGRCVGSVVDDVVGCALGAPWWDPAPTTGAGSVASGAPIRVGMTAAHPGAGTTLSVVQPDASCYNNWYAAFGWSASRASRAGTTILGAPRCATSPTSFDQDGSVFVYDDLGLGTEQRIQLSPDPAAAGSTGCTAELYADWGPAVPRNSGVNFAAEFPQSAQDLDFVSPIGKHAGLSSAVTADASVLVVGGVGHAWIYRRPDPAVLSYTLEATVSSCREHEATFGRSVALSPDGSVMYVAQPSRGSPMRKNFMIGNVYGGWGDVFIYRAPFTPGMLPFGSLRESVFTSDAPSHAAFARGQTWRGEYFGVTMRSSSTGVGVLLVGSSHSIYLFRQDDCTLGHTMEFSAEVAGLGGVYADINADGSLFAVVEFDGADHTLLVYAFPWQVRLRIPMPAQPSSVSFFSDADKVIVDFVADASLGFKVYDLRQEFDADRGVVLADAVPVVTCPVDNSLVAPVLTPHATTLPYCPLAGEARVPTMSSFSGAVLADALTVTNPTAGLQLVSGSLVVDLPPGALASDFAYRYCEYRLLDTAWTVIPCPVGVPSSISITGLRLPVHETVVLVRGCRSVYDCDDDVEVPVLPGAGTSVPVPPTVDLTSSSLTWSDFEDAGPTVEIRLGSSSAWISVSSSTTTATQGVLDFSALAHDHVVVGQVREKSGAPVGSSAPLRVDRTPPILGEVHLSETLGLHVLGFSDPESNLLSTMEVCLIPVTASRPFPGVGGSGGVWDALASVSSSPYAPVVVSNTLIVDKSRPYDGSRVSRFAAKGVSTSVTPVLVDEDFATVRVSGTQRSAAPVIDAAFDDGGPVIVTPHSLYAGLLLASAPALVDGRLVPGYASSVEDTQLLFVITADEVVDPACEYTTIPFSSFTSLKLSSNDPVVFAQVRVTNGAGSVVVAQSNPVTVASSSNGSSVITSSATPGRLEAIEPMDLGTMDRATSRSRTFSEAMTLSPRNGPTDSLGKALSILHLDMSLSQSGDSVIVEFIPGNRSTLCLGTSFGGCQLVPHALPIESSPITFPVEQLAASSLGIDESPRFCATQVAYVEVEERGWVLSGVGKTCLDMK